jgi:hypothetical protein
VCAEESFNWVSLSKGAVGQIALEIRPGPFQIFDFELWDMVCVGLRTIHAAATGRGVITAPGGKT